MTGGPRSLLGALLAGGATVLLAALSRAPQRMHGTEQGALRLSWSARPERIEVCREIPDAELRNLPEHMRQPVICEGRSADYRLTVLADGDTLADDRVHGGGARRDRPLYLYREFPVAPGSREITVRLERLAPAVPTVAPDSALGGSTPAQAVPPARGQTGHRLESLPPSLAFSRRLTIRPRAVVLITYDQERQEFVLRRGSEQR